VKNVADRSLIIGAILVGLIIAAAMWFLAISPKLSSAQAAREATTAQNDANVILARTLLQREKDAAEVPNYTREIYAIRDILPPTEDIPSVRRTIDEIVTSSGLNIEQDQIGGPQVIIGGISFASQMEEVGLTSLVEGMTFGTLLGTSYSFEVTGTTGQVIAIIDKLQKDDHRCFSITNLSITGSVSDDSDSVRASISLLFFTLDYGIPDITVRPPERPWPGTEEESP
jgi:hypothetical protein